MPPSHKQMKMSNGEKSENNDAEVIVNESKKSELSGFLKTLSTFTGDIYSLTCPSFLLSGVSTLEYWYVLTKNYLFHSHVPYVLAAFMDIYGFNNFNTIL